MLLIIAIVLLVCFLGGAILDLAKWALILFVLGAAFSAGAHFFRRNSRR